MGEAGRQGDREWGDGRMDSCPLALECFGENDECENVEYCHYWTQAWDLYEIFLLGDLPAIYLDNGGDRNDWTKIEYGFVRLNNCDFLLYYAARYCPFKYWKQAYYSLNRKRSAYVRSSDLDRIERLRSSIDKEYGRLKTGEEDIPFVRSLIPELPHLACLISTKLKANARR